MPTNGFSIKPLKVKLLAGEQKATEKFRRFLGLDSTRVASKRLGYSFLWAPPVSSVAVSPFLARRAGGS